MTPLHALAAGSYLVAFAVLLLGVSRRAATALIASALAVAVITAFLFVGYPVMMRGSEKVVRVHYSPVVPTGDPLSYKFEDWAATTPEGLIQVVVKTKLGGEMSLELDPSEGVVVDSAIPGWADVGGRVMPDRMPRYAQVSCRWSDPVVDFLQAGCEEERSWALILPSLPDA